MTQTTKTQSLPIRWKCFPGTNAKSVTWFEPYGTTKPRELPAIDDVAARDLAFVEAAADDLVAELRAGRDPLTGEPGDWTGWRLVCGIAISDHGQPAMGQITAARTV